MICSFAIYSFHFCIVLTNLAHYDIASKMNIHLHTHNIKKRRKRIGCEWNERYDVDCKDASKQKHKGGMNRSGNVLRQPWFVFTIHNTTVNCSTAYDKSMCKCQLTDTGYNYYYFYFSELSLAWSVMSYIFLIHVYPLIQKLLFLTIIFFSSIIVVNTTDTEKSGVFTLERKLYGSCHMYDSHSMSLSYNEFGNYSRLLCQCSCRWLAYIRTNNFSPLCVS